MDDCYFGGEFIATAAYFSGIKKPLLVSYRLVNFDLQRAELTLIGTEPTLALDKFLYQPPRLSEIVVLYS